MRLPPDYHNPGLLEKHRQALILKRLRSRGAIAYKVDAASSMRGVPDLFAQIAGWSLHIEVKRPAGKVSVAQRHCHVLLSAQLGIVLIATCWVQVKAVLDWLDTTKVEP